MRAAHASRGRHAECAYLLDRAVKNPSSSEEFGRSALDALRLALRPAYAALVCHQATTSFRCGDQALSGDLDAIAELLRSAPLSLLSRPRCIVRRQGDAAGATYLMTLDRAMSASALELLYPLTDGSTLLGVIAVGPRPDRSAYLDDDLEFVDRVGARLALLASREALAAEVAKLRAASASSERLASVGRMAAGLAHEIRNPLVSIRTFTQLLPERHADEEFRSSFLDLTLSEIDRISTLVGEILSYARPEARACDDEDTPSADVADCVERTCLLLRSHARSAGVALEFESDELPERASIDEDKLRQIVINLVVNGIQACDGRGQVTVKATAPEGRAIVLEIRDDGPGMKPDVAARIFEPFFTTRREGTGLGLALVRRLLEDADAGIDVSTAAGHGTTFRITLQPVSAVASSQSANAGEDSAPARPAASSSSKRDRHHEEAVESEEPASLAALDAALEPVL